MHLERYTSKFDHILELVKIVKNYFNEWFPTLCYKNNLFSKLCLVYITSLSLKFCFGIHDRLEIPVHEQRRCHRPANEKPFRSHEDISKSQNILTS